MVKHIVMFKLSEKNPENMERAINSLRSLEGNVERNLRKKPKDKK